MFKELLDLCQLNLIEEHILQDCVGEGIKTPIDKERDNILKAILWKKQQIMQKIEPSEIVISDWDERIKKDKIYWDKYVEENEYIVEDMIERLR